ncbi:uncharacterized protein EI97DRAFT_497634 [Westerdykella ornata]|uniref:Uncharacterized protein n=1 Tax=Westerdykella ornata TaxID=318751 RepID=A0A6A6JXU6_WESOR|nr:uncharacterized protein EI97DRAFT_497634 [Westerdykella ornata]KAF2280903.1 hypothetical protein EI97DRAFT_497634 [Westerdykella ornata]
MPREPFLTRIGLGRSPFLNTPSITRTAHYFQIAEGEEIPQHILHPDDGRYIQIYDERGHPINPLAKEFARKSRHALNEITAATGVVEKYLPPSEKLPGPSDEYHKRIELEDKYWYWLERAFNQGSVLSRWWLGNIVARLCAFDFPSSMTIAEILASECRLSGLSIFYAGMDLRILSALVGYVVTSLEKSSTLERILRATGFSRATRIWVGRFSCILLYMAKAAEYPVYYSFWYRESLQRLGLLPTTMASFWDAVPQCTSLLSSLPSEVHFSKPTFLRLAKAVLVWPAPWAFLITLWTTWVQHTAFWPLLATIDSPASNAPKRQLVRHIRVNASRCTWAHRTLLHASNRIFGVLGWRSNHHVIQVRERHPGEVEVSGTVVTNLQPLESLEEAVGQLARPGRSAVRGEWTTCRITPLSMLPASTAVTICAKFVGRLAELPLDVVMYRLVAGHYLLAPGGHVSSTRLGRYRLLDPLAELRSMDMRWACTLLSRLVFFEGVGLAIEFGLFFFQWGLSTYVGKKYFGWGDPERRQ